MALLNITLNQEEILSLLSENSPNAFKKLLQESLNAVLKAESNEQLKAAPYERTEERTDSRNGSRERTLCTRIGSIPLTVPRHRKTPFKTMVFENYSRSEASLIAVMSEMVVNGVSTRKVSRVVEELCGTSISKSAVSELCKDLDKSVREFKDRPLEGAYPLVITDATYFKVRVDHRVISKAFMIAIGINDRGRREIIGFDLYDNESKETWQEFFLSLRARGLKNVRMITSDAHEGILYGISHVFPDTPWQRCQFHFTKNIIEKAPKKYQEGLRSEIQAMFQCTEIQEARRRQARILQDYAEVAPNAMECLELGFESAMTVMYLPGIFRTLMRTSNHVERVNRELKRRAAAIGVFPNEASVLRLMGAVLMEYHERNLLKQQYIYGPAFTELHSAAEELRKHAHEQNQLLIA